MSHTEAYSGQRWHDPENISPVDHLPHRSDCGHVIEADCPYCLSGGESKGGEVSREPCPASPSQLYPKTDTTNFTQPLNPRGNPDWKGRVSLPPQSLDEIVGKAAQWTNDFQHYEKRKTIIRRACEEAEDIGLKRGLKHGQMLSDILERTKRENVDLRRQVEILTRENDGRDQSEADYAAAMVKEVQARDKIIAELKNRHEHTN